MRQGMIWMALVLSLLGHASVAGATGRAGTAWRFGATSGFKKLDGYNVLRAGGTRSLRGGACCNSFTVVFPTETTFSLRQDSSEVATGSVEARGSRLILIPDAASLGILRWWTENEIESFWNAGVFSLGLSLRASQLVSQSMTIVTHSARGGRQIGILKIAVHVAGAVLRVDPARIRGNRFAPGQAKGQVLFKDKLVEVSDIGSVEEAYPYPPEVACDQIDEEIRSARWPGGPDYCYDVQ